MADKSSKVPENVAGKYYVDSSCDLCAVCEATAPDNFKLGDEHAFVFKQPENDEEEAMCQDAMDACPEGSIGDDGE